MPETVPVCLTLYPIRYGVLVENTNKLMPSTLKRSMYIKLLGKEDLCLLEGSSIKCQLAKTADIEGLQSNIVEDNLE